jgi:hypothetical protein
MTRKIKASVKAILFILFSIIAILVIHTYIISFEFGYKEIDNPLNYYLTILKPEIEKNLTLNSIYWNHQNDSAFFYTYGQTSKVLIWKINEFNDVSIPEIRFIQSNSTSGLKNHTVIVDNQFPHFALIVKPELKKTDTLEIALQNEREDSEKELLVRGANYLYFSKNFDNILLYDGRRELKIVISKFPGSPSVNCLFFKSRGYFYLIFLYSLNKNKIPANSLLNLIELTPSS